MADVIQAGDRVRSFDFEGREDCYVEGVVERLTWMDGCPRYQILAERRVALGEEVALPAGAGKPWYVYPPVNGTRKLGGGVCEYVHKVKAEDSLNKSRVSVPCNAEVAFVDCEGRLVRGVAVETFADAAGVRRVKIAKDDGYTVCPAIERVAVL